MRRLPRFLVLGLLIPALWAAPAAAQSVPNLPANSVWGRLGAGQAGPSEAIPFTTLWGQLTAANGQALTESNDTNVTMTLGGSPTTAVLNATSMTMGWTGTLAIGRGGTGQSSLTANAFLTGNGTSGINAVGLTGLVLGNGASAPTAYAGTSCTNQFPRSLNANGAATCATVANTDLANSSLTLGSTSMALGSTTTSVAGNITWSGNNTYSGTSEFTGGLFTFSGNGQASVGQSTTNGGLFGGQGSIYDSALVNKSGSVGIGVSTGTQDSVFGGKITAASLATPSSNIAGTICATSGGSLLYNSGANCFAGGGTAGGSNTQVQYNNTTNLAGISGVTSNGTAMTFAASDLVLSGLQSWNQQITLNPALTITSATAAVWDDLNLPTTTTTISGNTGSPITAMSRTHLYRPTLTDSSAVTVTTAATLTVDDCPLASGSVTITNCYAFNAAAGIAKFGGSQIVGAATGGSEGTGTVNVSGNYYVNGVAVAANRIQFDFCATGINFNSVADTSIAITLPAGLSRYYVADQWIENASASLTLSKVGLFTASGGGGTTIVPSTAVTVSTSSDGTNNNMQGIGSTNGGGQSFTTATFGTLFYRVTQAQGSAATATGCIRVLGFP